MNWRKKRIKSPDWDAYLPELESYYKGLTKIEKGPAFAWLEITTACNLKCKHCFTSMEVFARRHKDKLNKFMEMNMFELWRKKVLPFIHSVSLEGTAGESFLHPELDYIITKVIEEETLPCIVTNGTIFKEESMKKILKSGGRIIVSLDGITDKTYNKIRAGADFEEVWQNILTLQKMKKGTKGQLFINNVFQKDNWFETEELIEKCLAAGIDKIIINELLASIATSDEILPLQVPPEALEHIKKCIDRYSDNKKVLFNLYSFYKNSNKNNTCCSPWIHFWTGLWGHCRICCVGADKYWEKISGIILTEDFDILEFLNKRELIKLRENMLKGVFTDFCKNCHMVWGVNGPYFNRLPP